MSYRITEMLSSFLVTFALGVAVSALTLRLWYRYVVGACAIDWTLAVILGLAIAVGVTALEVLVARGGAGSRRR